jgi:hypothetical protein
LANKTLNGEIDADALRGLRIGIFLTRKIPWLLHPYAGRIVFPFLIIDAIW